MLEEAIGGRIELVLPELVLDELERVLTEKLGFSEERSRAARELLAQVATNWPGPAQSPESITGDATDDVILACAVEAGAEVLATGDKKHLLRLGEYHGVRLLTPQAVLAELRAQGL